MSGDLAVQLQSLQNLRQLLGEELYAAKLQQLRERFGVEAVDLLLVQVEPAASTPAPATHDLKVSEGASVGAAVAGNVYGHLFIGGRRSQSAAQLLAGYLHSLIPHCDALPLHAMRDRSDLDDALGVTLEQVYTQLATTALVPRETLSGEALAQLDAEQFLNTYVRGNPLPLQERRSLRWASGDGDRGRSAPGDLLAGGDLDRSGALLRGLSAADLARMAKEHAELTFLGPQLVTEAIAEQPRLVLLGEPGSGKSTALRYLALTLAHAMLNADTDTREALAGWEALGEGAKLIPLFIPLLPFAQRLAREPQSAGSAAELWNHIAAQLVPQGADSGLAEAMYLELQAGRALLLLDGLDEVAGGDSRTMVVRAVEAFAREHPRCRIAVSCRVRAYEGDENKAWRLAGWPTATLDEWTLGQMQSFVDAWYRTAGARMDAAERERRRQGLRGALDTRADLRRIGGRPLLMTITALVHLTDGQLPEGRAGLYSRCVDILLARWESGRAETGYTSAYGTLMEYINLKEADVKSLRPLLQRAAFLAHEAGTAEEAGSLSRAALRDLVAEELAARSHANPFEGANRFLDYADQRAGILQARSVRDAYVFPHQTFQEYLAGLQLVSGVDFVDQIMARRTDDRWRVPIVLGVGHLVGEGALAMPYQLLSELTYGEEPDQVRRERDLIFAAEVAAEVGWPRLERGGAGYKQLRRDLAQRLATVVEGTTRPAIDRVRAGRLLGDLGDPRPGVCTLPPAMVAIPGGSFVIGSTAEEAEAAGLLYEQYYLAQGDAETAKRAKGWPRDEINDQPLELAAFEIARYPVTNAQYKLFIDAGGYDPRAPWWDDAGRAWLARDDASTEGLEDYQRRDRKDQPVWWDHKEVGIARPNYPVLAINWYEAMAYCRWLTQHLNDGFKYLLPSEAEWEYAARRAVRRPYPWGDHEPDGERANFDRLFQYTTAVGSFALGVTPEDRVFDLAGNVWDWTRSAYRPYPYDPLDGREHEPEPVKKYFTLRGGGWGSRPINLRASLRFHFTPGLLQRYRFPACPAP